MVGYTVAEPLSSQPLGELSSGDRIEVSGLLTIPTTLVM